VDNLELQVIRQESILDRRYAEIDLTSKSVSTKKIPKEWTEAYLGGRSLNMIFLFKQLENIGLVDAFDPKNPIILGTGILTGTGAPSSSRMNFTTISPESQVFCDANIGGFFGSHMRYSGFDMLIIKGKSSVPVYIYLNNEKIEFKSAENLWGLTTSETQANLENELGENIDTVCIGPAGENLVRYACVMSGLKSAAGRGGAGAVFGSKNLKAIVAHGGKGIPIADPINFFKIVQEYNQYLSESNIVKALGKYGTPLLYDVSNMLGAIRTNNSQLNAFSDSLNVNNFHEFVEKMVSCSSCVVHCRHRNKIPQKNNVQGEGPEYSTMGLLGANVGISDAKQVIILNNLVNDLGLDSSSTGTYLAWFIELFEKQLINIDQTAEKYEFGSFELIHKLINDLTTRTGFGDIIAEGSRASSKININNDLLIAIKGLPQSDPHDVRFIKSFSLGIATATRGADHLRSRPTLDILTSIPDNVLNKIYKTEVDRSPTSYKTKEFLVYFSENIFALQDSLGICRFICQGFNSPKLLGYSHFVELIKYATGMEFSESNLEEIGKNIINLERWINYKFFNIGFEGDTLPKRYFDEPMNIPDKPTTGEYIKREKFQEMLMNYYRLRGWIKEDGILELINPFSEEGIQ
jgi:aldehyde:ferredoxin oxidoreductase